MVIFQCPSCQFLFRLFLPGIIFGGACGVWNTNAFQRPPYITYQKTWQTPECAVKQICLVSMCHINIMAFKFIMQYNSWIKRNIRKKRPVTKCFYTIKRKEMLFRKFTAFFSYIMVAINCKKAVLPVKQWEHFKTLHVVFLNALHRTVFP